MTWQTIYHIQNATDTSSLNSTTKFKIFTCKHSCVYIRYLSLWEGENSWDLAQSCSGKNCRSKVRVHKWKSSALCLYYQRGFLAFISSGKYQTVVQPPTNPKLSLKPVLLCALNHNLMPDSIFMLWKLLLHFLCNHINSISIAYRNSCPHLHIIQP